MKYTKKLVGENMILPRLHTPSGRISLLHTYLPLPSSDVVM